MSEFLRLMNYYCRAANSLLAVGVLLSLLRAIYNFYESERYESASSSS